MEQKRVGNLLLTLTAENYLIPWLTLNSPVNIGHHQQTPGTSAKALTTAEEISASDGQLESRQPNGNPSISMLASVTDANIENL
jgi:hypothetical protein